MLLALSEEISEGRDDGFATPTHGVCSQQVKRKGSSATD